MVVVDDLEERLDAGALGDLLLRHGLGDLEGCTVNSSKNSVRVFALLSALIKVLDDDGLSSSVSTLENDDDLSWLQTRA